VADEVECNPDENIVRAILQADWDETKSEYQSDVFRGPDTSVSRLKISSLAEILAIFQADFDAYQEGPVLGTGEINVGELKEMGQNYLDGKGKPLKQAVTVVEMPTDKNPSHAEVKERFSRGFARQVIRALKKLRINGEALPEG